MALSCKCISPTAETKDCYGLSPSVPDGPDGYCYIDKDTNNGGGCSVTCDGKSSKSVACCTK